MLWGGITAEAAEHATTAVDLLGMKQLLVQSITRNTSGNSYTYGPL